MTELLSGWGRATATAGHVRDVEGAEAVSHAVRSADGRGVLVRGLGRAYGDAALNAGGTLLRLPRSAPVPVPGPDGTVTVAAGTSLGALLDAVLPHGWFVPVTPGTRHVTVGGALAADVHGKNHHRDGTFGAHVESLTLVDGTGEVRVLERGDPLLGAVLGGMGLAGVVLSARVRLLPVTSSSVTVHTRRTSSLEATMSALVEDDAAHRYTVAWVDLVVGGRAHGRGVVTSGDHADRDEPGARPVEMHRGPRAVDLPPSPVGVVGRNGLRAFNELYLRRAPVRPTVTRQDPTTFFHPLDVVGRWNRLYGPRGFVQYQVAVPTDDDLLDLVALLHRERVVVALAVLKRFGPASGSPLSFPVPGWTLALDVPADPGVAPALDRADALVAAAGGRTYLAKDARTRPDVLATMYPELPRWRSLRERLDPHHVFTSDLARRLQL